MWNYAGWTSPLQIYNSSILLFPSCPYGIWLPCQWLLVGLLLYHHLNTPPDTHTHTFSRCWSNKSISLLLLSRHHLPAHLIRYNPLHIKNLLSATNLNTHSLHVILTIEINGTCCVLHVRSAGVKERVGALFISTRVASLGLHQQQGEQRRPVPAFFPSTL